MTSEPRVQIEIPVADLLEPFLDRYRYVYGSGDYNLLTQVVAKTTDKVLLAHVAEKAMARLAEMYGTDADRYDELSISGTFEHGSADSVVRGYGTRAENSRNRNKAYKVLGKLLGMVRDAKTGLEKVARINPSKL